VNIRVLEHPPRADSCAVVLRFAVLRRGGMWTRMVERIDTAARNRAIYSPCSPVRSASARSASPSCPDPAVSSCLLRR
jgi:hypothetical protein